MSPEEADYLLDEWARWQSDDPLTMTWKRSTSFGKRIIPDPAPARRPVDEARALRTDRVIARLPGRLRFLVRLHYLDRAPIDAKARRMRERREAYKARVEGLLRVVSARLDGTAELAYKEHTAIGA